LRGLSFESKLIATSVLGGLASVAGGGKFANGAITAAFGYLFNQMGEEQRGKWKSYEDAVFETWKDAQEGTVPLAVGITGNPMQSGDAINSWEVMGEEGSRVSRSSITARSGVDFRPFRAFRGVPVE